MKVYKTRLTKAVEYFFSVINEIYSEKKKIIIYDISFDKYEDQWEILEYSLKSNLDLEKWEDIFEK